MEFQEILVQTDRDFESISEHQLAYALVTNGLKHAETLMKKTGSTFVIAFAFEGSEAFYFATDNIVPIRTEAMEKLALRGHASKMPTMALSPDHNFILVVRSWDSIKLTTTQEAF